MSQAYSNLRLEQLAQRSMPASASFGPADIIGSVFLTQADNRIASIVTQGYVQLKSTPDQTILWRVYDNDLNITSEVGIQNSGGPGFSSGQLNVNFRTLSANYSTQQFVTDEPNGVLSVFSFSGAGFLYVNSIRPGDGASITYPTPAGWQLGGVKTLTADSIWMRPTGVFVGINQNLYGYDYELHRYPSVIPQASYVELIPGMRWGSATPANASARLQLSIPGTTGFPYFRYVMYVPPAGERVWTLSTRMATTMYVLTEYDESLVEIGTQSIAFAFPAAGEPIAFALQDDFLWTLDHTGLFRFWRLSTQEQLGEIDLVTTEGHTAKLPSRIFPNPDGLLYIQIRQSGPSDEGNESILRTFRFGDPVEFSCDTVGVDQIVFDLARRAGIPPGRIDVSGIALDSDYGHVAGFGIGRAASARTMIEILQRAKFFDVTEIGGIVAARRRDRAPDGVIGGDDLRAHAYGESPPTLATRERIEDYEIPVEVRVEYSQLAAEYEAGVESYSRRVTDASGVLDVDLSAIAMDPDEAAVIAEATLLEAVIARESIECHLVATSANKNLKPGDIKTLQVVDREDVVRITDIGYAYPGIQRIKMLRHDPSVYTSDAEGAGRSSPGSVILLRGPTTFELLDAPLVRSHDDITGYFAALGGIPTIPGVFEGWPGGDLERLQLEWEGIARVLRPGAGFGTCETMLADGNHKMINDQFLNVSVDSGFLLQSRTVEELCRGANLAAVEVRPASNEENEFEPGRFFLSGWDGDRFIGWDGEFLPGDSRVRSAVYVSANGRTFTRTGSLAGPHALSRHDNLGRNQRDWVVSPVFYASGIKTQDIGQAFNRAHNKEWINTEWPADGHFTAIPSGTTAVASCKAWDTENDRMIALTSTGTRFVSVSPGSAGISSIGGITINSAAINPETWFAGGWLRLFKRGGRYFTFNSALGAQYQVSTLGLMYSSDFLDFTFAANGHSDATATPAGYSFFRPYGVAWNGTAIVMSAIARQDSPEEWGDMMLRSTDNGETFSIVNWRTPISGEGVSSYPQIAALGSAGFIACGFGIQGSLVADPGVLISTDNGATWTRHEIDGPLPQNPNAGAGVVVASRKTGPIIQSSGFQGEEMWWSEDGITWTRVNYRLSPQSRRWELIRFRDVEFISGGARISGLVRGVNGTEWATGLHQTGDRVVFLGEEQQIPASLPEIGQDRQHNASTIGSISDPENQVSFAWQAVDRVPWAPCNLEIARDSNDDLLISWNRRDRMGQELSPTLPLSEASEAYAIDIYDEDGVIILRTLSTSSPEATYTAAQQTADFGSDLPTALDVAVYQIGELGRGYPLRATIEGL